MINLFSNSQDHQNLFLLLVSIITLSACTSGNNIKTNLHPEITAGDLLFHARKLSPQRKDTRPAGSPQEAITANYIADAFNLFGLTPMGDDSTYYQEFTIASGVTLGKEGNNIHYGSKRLSTRFNEIIPWANSISSKIEGTLAWVGYGKINPDIGYNDYASVNVKGKVVLIIQNDHDGIPKKDPDPYKVIAHKVHLAEDNGAVAVIIAPGYGSGSEANYLSLKKFDPSILISKIPVMQVSNRIASNIMADAGLNFKKLQATIDAGHKPNSKVTGLRVRVEVNLNKRKNITRNIVSGLKGSKYTQRYIVISAPYDYTTLTTNDNFTKLTQQSDPASLLELAQHFSKDTTNNSLLFVALSGNHNGRKGLQDFLKEAQIDPDQILVLINLEGIARYPNDKMSVNSFLPDPGWKDVLIKSNSDKIHLRLNKSINNEDDTTLIHQLQIPTIRMKSHRTAKDNKAQDERDYFKGTATTLKYVSRVIQKIDSMAAAPDTLGFTTRTHRYIQNFRMPDVTLGIMPDYYFRGEGLRIRFVAKGHPAYDAGLQVGDIITSINGKNVINLYDYIDILNTLQKGDQSLLTILRDGKRMKVEVRF
jgi:hypothetical protein